MFIFGNYIEFTKIIQLVLVLLYYGFFAFCSFTYANENKYMKEMLDCIAFPFTVVTASYFMKSSIENKAKINNDFQEERLQTSFSFSKLLTLVIIVGYIISVIIFSIIWANTGRFSEELFEYISYPLIGILPFYFGKSIIENKAIFKNKNIITTTLETVIHKDLDGDGKIGLEESSSNNTTEKTANGIINMESLIEKLNIDKNNFISIINEIEKNKNDNSSKITNQIDLTKLTNKELEDLIGNIKIK